jgi:hypothetical protein
VRRPASVEAVPPSKLPAWSLGFEPVALSAFRNVLQGRSRRRSLLPPSARCASDVRCRIKVEPFTITVDEEVLIDLRERIARTRWPDHISGTGWGYGADVEYLRELLASWAEFDWREQEAELNGLAHFRAEIDGLRIHFVHERGTGPAPLPIVLTHGFPSSFVEYLDLLPLLTDPAAHGGAPKTRST